MSRRDYSTALVTGASRGVGAEIVRALARRGYRVTAVARDAEALDALAEETGCQPLPLDLADGDAVARALVGREIDVVVNNAGMIAKVAPFIEQEMEDVDRLIALNLRAAMAVTHALLPGMVERGRGHLFLITSQIGHYALPNVGVYAATKAALHAFGEGLRLELAGSGVRLTEIAPGRIETGIYLEAMGGDVQRVKETLYERYRALQPEDVAEALIGALALPSRADASLILLSPTDQATGGSVYAERKK